MVLALALVAAAMYGLLFLLRKFYRKGANSDTFVKVLGSAALGANKAVYVVSVGTKAWLVGAAENGVSLIAEIAEQETVDAMLLEESRRNADGVRKAGFTNLFSRVAHGPRTDITAEDAAASASDSNESPPSVDRLRKTRERLQGLQ